MNYNITYRQKDKGWQYIINVKKDNKWKYITSKQGFIKKSHAKKAADKKLDEMKEDFELEETIDEEYSDITFAEFKEIFIKNKEIHRENNTVTNYKTAFNHFKKIENIEMKNIRFIDIQECIDEMVKKDLHPNTVRTYTSRIKNLFFMAVKPYAVIAKNPIDSDFILPEVKQETKIKALTKLQLDELLEKMYPETDYMICFLAATTGMRIGEILGLCEYDIDIASSTIDVRRQWKKLKSGEYGFGSLKTKNSYRSIPVSPNTMGGLRNYINNSKVIDFNRRIFQDKKTVSATTRFSVKFKRLGFDNSIHDLRHTYVTLLIYNGVDFKTISELIGDTVETVMKTYAHITSDMTEKASQKISQIF